MPDIDSFARQLLEEAKRFLEKSRDADDESAARNAYLHAALMLAFRCLEAHLNAAADDFVRRGDLSLHDRSVMFEQEVRLENGEFVLKMHVTAQRGDHLIQGALRYQACDMTTCFPPRNAPVAVDVIAH